MSAERQTHQNILKLKGVTPTNWRQLVDLIYSQHLQASDENIGNLIGYIGSQIQQSAAEIAAASSNMNNIVQLLHDPQSQLLIGVLQALTEGLIAVIDISMLSSTAGNTIAGLILRRIFSHNQKNFTGGQSPVPVVTVIEEAQSVLGRNLEETSPFEEINSEPNRKIKVIYEDSLSEPQKAVSAFNKLIEIDKVPVVIGHVLSSEVLACAPIANQRKVLILNTSAGTEDLRKAGNYIFRNRESAYPQAFRIAEL